MNTITRILTTLLLFTLITATHQTLKAETEYPVTYNTVEINDVDIFYREAGNPENPTILLLHGFPTSSHMFRNLIPALADDYYLVAPDYPGFRQQRTAPL